MSGMFSCKECEGSSVATHFDLERELDAHICTTHLKWNPFECYVCGVGAPTDHSLKCHFSRHQPHYEYKLMYKPNPDMLAQLFSLKQYNPPQQPLFQPLPHNNVQTISRPSLQHQFYPPQDMGRQQHHQVKRELTMQNSDINIADEFKIEPAHPFPTPSSGYGTPQRYTGRQGPNRNIGSHSQGNGNDQNLFPYIVDNSSQIQQNVNTSSGIHSVDIPNHTGTDLSDPPSVKKDGNAKQVQDNHADDGNTSGSGTEDSDDSDYSEESEEDKTEMDTPTPTQRTLRPRRGPAKRRTRNTSSTPAVDESGDDNESEHKTPSNPLDQANVGESVKTVTQLNIDCRMCGWKSKRRGVKEAVPSQRWRIKSHVFTRHIDKPLVRCPYCSKTERFSVYVIRKHMKKVHGNESEAIIDERHKYDEELAIWKEKCFGHCEDMKPLFENENNDKRFAKSRSKGKRLRMSLDEPSNSMSKSHKQRRRYTSPGKIELRVEKRNNNESNKGTQCTEEEDQTETSPSKEKKESEADGIVDEKVPENVNDKDCVKDLLSESHGTEQKQESQYPPTYDKQLHTCAICKKTVRSKAAHVYSRHVQKPLYRCPHNNCNVSSNFNQSNVAHHIRMMHKKEQPKSIINNTAVYHEEYREMTLKCFPKEDKLTGYRKRKSRTSLNSLTNNDQQMDTPTSNRKRERNQEDDNIATGNEVAERGRDRLRRRLKLFECSQCQETTTAKASHIYVSHMSKPRFECPVEGCLVSSKFLRTSLLHHMENRHLLSAPNQIVDNHQVLLEEFDQWKMKCFGNNSSKRTTWTPHTETKAGRKDDGSKYTFVCSLCSRAATCRIFSMRTTVMRIHIYIHHLKKPAMRCSYPGCTFSDHYNKANVQTHIKKAHPGLKAIGGVIDDRNAYKQECDELFPLCFGGKEVDGSGESEKGKGVEGKEVKREVMEFQVHPRPHRTPHQEEEKDSDVEIFEDNLE